MAPHKTLVQFCATTMMAREHQPRHDAAMDMASGIFLVDLMHDRPTVVLSFWQAHTQLCHRTSTKSRHKPVPPEGIVTVPYGTHPCIAKCMASVGLCDVVLHNLYMGLLLTCSMC